MSSNSKLKQATDISVIQRLRLLLPFYLLILPDLWEIVARFAVAKSDASILPEQARTIVDNITYTDEYVLMPDDEPFTELTMMPFISKEHIGVNLF